MHPTELAYLAGLLDGEGCFYGRLVNKTANLQGGNIELRIAIQATSMTMIAKVAECYTRLGLKPTVEIGRFQLRSTKPAHKVSIHRKADVEKLIRAVLPFLVVKKPEAEMMLEWLDQWGADMRGPGKITPPYEERVVFLKRLSDAKKCA